jgi:hypothetical protein
MKLNLDLDKMTPKGSFWFQMCNPLVTEIDVSQQPFNFDANDAVKILAALEYECCLLQCRSILALELLFFCM